MYHLFLSPANMESITWVGGRYSWSSALLDHCEQGDNEIPENIAWEINEAFEEDTKGGHSFFPCLDLSSNLAEKLFQFMREIV